MDDLLRNIKDKILDLETLQKQALKQVTEDVYNIINNKITNESIIESTLDKLLDLAYFFGKDLGNIYYLLLNYYKGISLENSLQYEKFYLEIIGNNDYVKEL